MRKPLLRSYKTLGIIAINVLFCLSGSALVVLGVFSVIDNANISELFGTTLYTSGVYTSIFFGIIVFVAAIFGSVAFVKFNYFLIVTYIAIMCISTVFLFISSVILFAFKGSIGIAAKSIMTQSLKIQYGRYKIVTEAWNAAQSRLRCCGVDDLGWHVYNDSWWDAFINRDIYESNSKIPRTSPFYKFVPESCCSTLIDGLTGWPTNNYRDLFRCQNWQYGPPNYLHGPHNDAIYYAGCFESIKEYIGQFGLALGALTLFMFFMMVAIIFLSLLSLFSGRPRKKKNANDNYPYVKVPT